MRRNLWLAIGIIGGAFAASLVHAAWHRFGPATYARFNTMFGRARVYEVSDDEGCAVRLLEVGGIVQSGTYVDEAGPRYADLVFEYLKRYDALFYGADGAERPVGRVCVLGCGGYDYPIHLLAHHPEVRIDAVEIDPAITGIARRYFYLDRAIAEFDPDGKRLNLACTDASEFLEGANERYDAIVNDTFDAGKPPAHLTTPAFARLVRNRLAEGGMYLTNIVAPPIGSARRVPS